MIVVAYLRESMIMPVTGWLYRFYRLDGLHGWDYLQLC